MNTVDGRTPAYLRVDRTDDGDGRTCLAVAGEVDMTTGDAFRRDVLGALAEPGARNVQLDVAAITFIDSHGVAVLVQARRLADERGVGFAVLRAGHVVRSVLEMLGVYALLTEPDGPVRPA